jgi:hypothetical protein
MYSKKHDHLRRRALMMCLRRKERVKDQSTMSVPKQDLTAMG